MHDRLGGMLNPILFRGLDTFNIDRQQRVTAVNVVNVDFAMGMLTCSMRRNRCSHPSRNVYNVHYVHSPTCYLGLDCSSGPGESPLHSGQRRHSSLKKRSILRSMPWLPNCGQGNLRLTREGGGRMVLRRDRVKIGNSGLMAPLSGFSVHT